MTPRDVHFATAAGGGLTGAALLAVGARRLAAACSSSNQFRDAFESVAFFNAGAASFIVSVILVPSRPVLRWETSARS